MELESAKLVAQYTGTRHEHVADYYGLLDPDNFDPTPYVERYVEDMRLEYHNE